MRGPTEDYWQALYRKAILRALDAEQNYQKTTTAYNKLRAENIALRTELYKHRLHTPTP